MAWLTMEWQTNKKDAIAQQFLKKIFSFIPIFFLAIALSLFLPERLAEILQKQNLVCVCA